MARQKYGGAPWLYDETTGDIVGVKAQLMKWLHEGTRIFMCRT